MPSRLIHRVVANDSKIIYIISSKENYEKSVKKLAFNTYYIQYLYFAIKKICLT